MDEPYDASDPKAVKAKRLSARDAERRRLEMVAGIMSLPQGREWVWDLLAFCGVFTTPFSTSALVMAFNAGKGDVGRQILADVARAAPDHYIEMLKEKQDGRPDSNPSGSASSPGTDPSGSDDYSTGDPSGEHG